MDSTQLHWICFHYLIMSWSARKGNLGLKTRRVSMQIVNSASEPKNKALERIEAEKRRPISFGPGDLFWIHLSKGRFPNKRKSKFMPRADGPLKVVQKVNSNAYKAELPEDYNVSSKFNVKDLAAYYEDEDLRANPSVEGEDDGAILDEAVVYEVAASVGPIARARAKQLQAETLKMAPSFIEIEDRGPSCPYLTSGANSNFNQWAATYVCLTWDNGGSKKRGTPQIGVTVCCIRITITFK